MTSQIEPLDFMKNECAYYIDVHVRTCSITCLIYSQAYRLIAPTYPVSTSHTGDSSRALLQVQVQRYTCTQSTVHVTCLWHKRLKLIWVENHDNYFCVDPPTVMLLVKAVASVSDWSTLGLYLGLEPAVLTDIHTTHHVQGLNTLKMVMFDKWLKKCPRRNVHK